MATRQTWQIWPMLMFAGAGLAASVAVYWPTVSYGFAYDDYYLVRPHTLEEVRRAFAGSWYPHDVMVPFYRPLTVAFHAARFALFHFDPRPYHGLSLLLFGVIAALVGLVTRQVLSTTDADADAGGGVGVGAGVGAGLFAIAATAVHPSLPYSLVAWTTNQMHLVQSIVVLAAMLWWHAFRRRGSRGWLPLLGFAAVAFLIKEDGVMLLPCLLALELLYGRIVERRWTIPPPLFLIGAALTIGALIWIRSWALHGIGGYSKPDWDMMRANFAQGLSRALLYQPFDRPGKAFVGYTVIAVTLGGLLASFWRDDLRRARFLLLGGVTIAVAFNVPFVFVTKREQLYLLALGGTLAFVGGAVALWSVSRRLWLRAALAAMLVAVLIASGHIARLMAADFAPDNPITLGTDDIVQGWASVPLELHEFLARKHDAYAKRRQSEHIQVQLPNDVDTVTYGAYGWEADPSGQRFRWSTGTVTMFVRRSATRISIPLRAFPNPAGPVTVTISVDGRAQQPMTLASADWRSVSLWLPSLRLPWRMHIVKLEVEPTWVPAKLDPRSGDQRELGIKLGPPTLVDISRAAAP